MDHSYFYEIPHVRKYLIVKPHKNMNDPFLVKITGTSYKKHVFAFLLVFLRRNFEEFIQNILLVFDENMFLYMVQ